MQFTYDKTFLSKMPLAHEIAYTNTAPFVAYYSEQMPARLVQKLRAKIYKELPGLCCNYPSHKYKVDCPNECEVKFLNRVSNSPDAELIQKSETLKTIYLEIMRDYEYLMNITINDDDANNN
jgi:hypothetical protein